MTLDGVPLAGVEVFMFDTSGHGDPVRHTCTDGSGDYEFTEVHSYAVMATGPEVQPATPCSNPKFVDSDGTPLLVSFIGGGTGPATVDFHVERLPDENRGFFHQLKTALNDCYDGDGSSTADILDGFEEKVDKALDKKHPKVTEDAAGKYVKYAMDLGFISDGVCPQP